jgi:hypothetical protein
LAVGTATVVDMRDKNLPKPAIVTPEIRWWRAFVRAKWNKTYLAQLWDSSDSFPSQTRTAMRMVLQQKLDYLNGVKNNAVLHLCEYCDQPINRETLALHAECNEKLAKLYDGSLAMNIAAYELCLETVQL